ncbi:MAG: hypothetical protein KBB39_08890 [Phycicoccus sp.]|nr:hypothetical protein [Phycicoccus sp.]
MISTAISTMRGWWGLASARRATTAFLLSRFALMALVLVVATVRGVGAETHPLADGIWWIDRFSYWDSYHLIRIAESGYFEPGRACCDQAWFPGHPLVLRMLGPVFDGHTALAGIAVTLAAGSVAAWALWKVLRRDHPTWVAGRGVWLLIAAPYGVFLVAVYTEAVWLAGALLAWLAASRGRWWWAGLAACVTTATRVNGLFLLAGLVVLYAVSLRRAHTRPGWEVGALALPLVPPAAYVVWLQGQTGSWDAWREAQALGWQRHTMTPWGSMTHQIGEIAAAHSGALALTRSLDLLVVIGGIGVVLVLLWRREWAELAFLVPSVGVILTTSTYDSAGRYALTWFPVYLTLARESVHRRGRVAYAVAIGLGAALLVPLTNLFAQRQWIG